MRGIVLLLAASLAPAAAQPPAPQVGDTYEITLTRDSSTRDDDGSSGSSHDRDTLIERVIALRADGLELEYDLPAETGEDDKARQWQLPARIFRSNGGEMQLLNRPELEARVDAWLKRAKWPREVCGRWIFTWNAFRIDCDPQIVIETVKAFDLGAPVPGTAENPVDAEQVRRERAEGDVALGEIMQKPVTLEAALRERSKEAISGTVRTTFGAEADGEVQRRSKVTRLEIKGPERTETATITETLERRRIARRKAQD